MTAIDKQEEGDEVGFGANFEKIKRKLNDATPQEWDKATREIKSGADYPEDSVKAVDKQVGGNHYKKFVIQPAEFCYKNNIPYLESTAIKYLCRWRDKGGLQDLDKAIHFIELLKEFNSADSSVG